jgi:cytochrome bd-type quinol oxidase subunit 2
MGLRDFVAVVVSVLTFLGVIVLIGMVVRSFSPDYSPSQHPAERMALLFGSLIIALIVYNLIKSPEPEKKRKN